RQVFGESVIAEKILARTKAPDRPSHERAASVPRLDAAAKLQAALSRLGFSRSEASVAIGRALGGGSGLDVEQLLRKCLLLLVPAAS
ncbi:MAG TPA: hypothetical protein VEX18_02835, partial [Polyangiaceae bacterium]|nr:hypothetical protein [Polyangiaceae bacterium]